MTWLERFMSLPMKSMKRRTWKTYVHRFNGRAYRQWLNRLNGRHDRYKFYG